MPKLEDVHARLLKKKKERRELKKGAGDEMRNNARWVELGEKIDALKAERKAIETEIRGRNADTAKLEELKVDISSDTELLADIALNMYVQQLPVKIVDDFNATWTPVFGVKFKKE